MSRWMVAAVLVVAGCSGRPLGPVPIDTAHDVCDYCRMIISSTSTAAEVVAPGEEPRLFDDIGCLRDYLAAHRPPGNATIFVADHRTGAWVDATVAVFTRTPAGSTAMGSGVIAHASVVSRDADPAAGRGEALAAAAVLGGRAVAETRR